jgi:hypothetical protein
MGSKLSWKVALFRRTRMKARTKSQAKTVAQKQQPSVILLAALTRKALAVAGQVVASVCSTSTRR